MLFFSAQSGSLAAPSHTFLKQTSSQNGWSSFGYNAQGTRSNPYEQVLNPTNVSGLALNWTTTTTGFIGGNLSPVLANGIVYIGDENGALSALDAASGSLLWTYTDPAMSSSFTDTPTVVNGVVYIIDNHGTLIALDASTGLVLWTTNLSVGVFSGSPLVVGGTIYASFTQVPPTGLTPYLVALNAITGTLLWQTALGRSAAIPIMMNGVVYAQVGSYPAMLYAFDAKTGTILWMSGLSSSASRLAASNGMIYADVFTQTPASQHLYAFNASGCGSTTCSPLWIVSDGGVYGNPLPSPAVSNGVVYLGSDQLYAFNAKTGAILWMGASSSTNYNSSAAVANGVVYDATSDGHMYAFNASGCGSSTCSPLWTYTMSNAETQSSPAVANGMVYIGGFNSASPNNGVLFAFYLPNITPSPSPSPMPTVIVQKAWTAYSNNNTQTSFAPGDAIHYRVQVNNMNSTAVTATFFFLVNGQSQIFSWSGTKSVTSGTPTITLASNVPTTAPSGTYTLTVAVIYNGLSSQGESQFMVTSNPQILPVPSNNWTGYVSHNNGLNPVQYTRVDSTWTVPSEPCLSTTQPNRLDIWNGLGGDPSAPLEQVGIAVFCNNFPNSGFQVESWYEFLGDSQQPPAYFIPTNQPILAGDILTATTRYLGTKSSTNTCSSDPKLESPGGNGVYQFSISDKRTGWKFVSVRLCASDAPASRDSADWIVEGHGTLLNFDRVDFSSCGSSNGSISDGPYIQQVSMYALLQLQAFPSALSTDSTLFTVYWNHS